MLVHKLSIETKYSQTQSIKPVSADGKTDVVFLVCSYHPSHFVWGAGLTPGSDGNKFVFVCFLQIYKLKTFCKQFCIARQTVFRPLYLGHSSMVGPQWGQPL